MNLLANYLPDEDVSHVTILWHRFFRAALVTTYLLGNRTHPTHPPCALYPHTANR